MIVLILLHRQNIVNYDQNKCLNFDNGTLRRVMEKVMESRGILKEYKPCRSVILIVITYKSQDLKPRTADCGVG